MEVFISSDTSNTNSVFVEIVCRYLQITERKIASVLKVSETSKLTLKLASLPLLLSHGLKEPITDPIEIAKAISTEGGFCGWLFGLDDKEQGKISGFINHIITDWKSNPTALLQELNQALLLSTFMNDSLYPTACDLLAYSVISRELNLLPKEEQVKHCNAIRWADHWQNLKGIKSAARELKIWFSPAYESFVVKLVNTEPKAPGNPTAKTDDSKDESKHDQSKKDKKEKKAKGDKKGNQSQQEVHLMSQVDIRVGKVINIFPNPEGDKLFNEEIDIGNGEIRKIASGLRGRVDINDLKDSLVIVIWNLEARNLKGWESHGMILCANTKDDGKVEPLRPPKECQPGDVVYIGDLPRNPATDKKCPWKKVCNDWNVNDKKQATYKGELVWKTDKGDVVASSWANAVIS